MDSAYLQRIRFQLQKRFRRLNSCDSMFFHSALVQTWNHLNEQPLTAGIVADLDARAASYAEEVAALTSRHEIAEFTTDAEHAAFVFRVVQYCAQKPLTEQGYGPELTIAHAISNERNHNEALNDFRDMFLEPFYEYLDDALDKQAAVLSLLVKYKRKVEWFERDILSELAAGDERRLAKHLYAYLFDQGLDFSIEPQSASGEADLIAPELVLDAKVFDGSRRGNSYLAAGVHQVHTYCRDFNQEVGYLVVYKTCPETIDFTFSEAGQLAPFVKVGGKTIYIFVVDVCPYHKSASKRGALHTHTIEEKFLVRTAPDQTVASQEQAISPTTRAE